MIDELHPLRSLLGPYEALQHDMLSGKPVSWGHRIAHLVGPEGWAQLKTLGELEVLTYSAVRNIWGLILKRLTLEEALEQYGPITRQEIARGGKSFKQVTFGETTFFKPKFKPLKIKESA